MNNVTNITLARVVMDIDKEYWYYHKSSILESEKNYKNN